MSSAGDRIARFASMLTAPGLAVVLSASVASAGWNPLSAGYSAAPNSGNPFFIDDLGDAVAVSGSTAVIGADGVRNGSGAAYVYEKSRRGWQLQTALNDPGGAPGDAFGSAIAIQGSTLIIAADQAGNLNGVVYVYGRSGKRWIRRQKLNDPTGTLGDEFGSSITLSGSTAVITTDDLTGNADRVYIYGRSAAGWRFQTALSDPGGKPGMDAFGSAVAVSGTTIVVGAGNANKGIGAAYMYSRTGSRWTLHRALSDPLKKAGDSFGVSLAISSSAVLVGAPGVSRCAGAVYEYVRSGAAWRLRQTLRVRDGADGNFGGSLAISGKALVVSAPGAGPGANGVTYVYVGSGQRWRSQARLSDPAGGTADGFGAQVAVSGSIAVVGANQVNDGAGAAYMYGRSGSAWKRKFSVIDAFGAMGKLAGWAAAVDGPIAAVGAPRATDGAGAAYVYERSGASWRRRSVLLDPGGVEGDGGDAFGVSTAVSGQTIMVGAPGAKKSNGAVYVYVRSGTRWRKRAVLTHETKGATNGFGVAVASSGPAVIIGEGVGAAYIYAGSGSRWHRQASLTEPTGAEDLFGGAVAMSGGSAIVGATGADNGAGKAYIYSRSGLTWRQQAVLRPPGDAPGEDFGISVAITGATAIVGADGAGDAAGAAYVYVRTGTRWHLQNVLRNPKGVPGSGYGYAVSLWHSGSVTRALIGALSVSGLPLGSGQCGRVFEYVRSGSRWRERARVLDPQCRSFDEYGFAVALSGRTAVIGSPGADNNAGVTYVITVPKP